MLDRGFRHRAGHWSGRFAGAGLGTTLLRGTADTTGGCSLSVVMTGDYSNRPMEVHIMAQRLCFEGRARIEGMCENFRPGTLASWNIDPTRLNPRLAP